MVLHSECAWSAFLGGSLGLADAYADGLWSSPDLVALIRLVSAQHAGDRPLCARGCCH